MYQVDELVVNKLFRYDKETGDLIRKVTVSPTGKAGNKAGSLYETGYLRTCIEGRMYRNHRIIFLMHNGYLPACLDHIDTNKSNNLIENLRPATPSQNQHNRRLQSNNTSGVKGVIWNVKKKKWQAQVKTKGHQQHLGYFENILEAETVVREAREQLHGAFVNHGVCEEF